MTRPPPRRCWSAILLCGLVAVAAVNAQQQQQGVGGRVGNFLGRSAAGIQNILEGSILDPAYIGAGINAAAQTATGAATFAAQTATDAATTAGKMASEAGNQIAYGAYQGLQAAEGVAQMAAVQLNEFVRDPPTISDIRQEARGMRKKLSEAEMKVRDSVVSRLAGGERESAMGIIRSIGPLRSPAVLAGVVEDLVGKEDEKSPERSSLDILGDLLTELLQESPVDTQAAAAAIGAYLQSPKLPESAVLAEFMEPFMNSLTADNATSMAKQIVENVAGTEAFDTALDLMKPLGFGDVVPEMLTSIMPKLSPPDMLAFTQSVTQAMPVKEASKVFTDVLDGLVSEKDSSGVAAAVTALVAALPFTADKNSTSEDEGDIITLPSLLGEMLPAVKPDTLTATAAQLLMLFEIPAFAQVMAPVVKEAESPAKFVNSLVASLESILAPNELTEVVKAILTVPSLAEKELIQPAVSQVLETLTGEMTSAKEAEEGGRPALVSLMKGILTESDITSLLDFPSRVNIMKSTLEAVPDEQSFIKEVVAGFNDSDTSIPQEVANLLGGLLAKPSIVEVYPTQLVNQIVWNTDPTNLSRSLKLIARDLPAAIGNATEPIQKVTSHVLAASPVAADDIKEVLGEMSEKLGAEAVVESVVGALQWPKSEDEARDYINDILGGLLKLGDPSLIHDLIAKLVDHLPGKEVLHLLDPYLKLLDPADLEKIFAHILPDDLLKLPETLDPLKLLDFMLDFAAHLDMDLNNIKDIFVDAAVRIAKVLGDAVDLDYFYSVCVKLFRMFEHPEDILAILRPILDHLPFDQLVNALVDLSYRLTEIVNADDVGLVFAQIIGNEFLKVTSDATAVLELTHAIIDHLPKPILPHFIAELFMYSLDDLKRETTIKGLVSEVLHVLIIAIEDQEEIAKEVISLLINPLSALPAEEVGEFVKHLVTNSIKVHAKNIQIVLDFLGDLLFFDDIHTLLSPATYLRLLKDICELAPHELIEKIFHSRFVIRLVDAAVAVPAVFGDLIHLLIDLGKVPVELVVECIGRVIHSIDVEELLKIFADVALRLADAGKDLAVRVHKVLGGLVVHAVDFAAGGLDALLHLFTAALELIKLPEVFIRAVFEELVKVIHDGVALVEAIIHLIPAIKIEIPALADILRPIIHVLKPDHLLMLIDGLLGMVRSVSIDIHALLEKIFAEGTAALKALIALPVTVLYDLLPTLYDIGKIVEHVLVGLHERLPAVDFEAFIKHLLSIVELPHAFIKHVIDTIIRYSLMPLEHLRAIIKPLIPDMLSHIRHESEGNNNKTEDFDLTDPLAFLSLDALLENEPKIAGEFLGSAINLAEFPADAAAALGYGVVSALLPDAEKLSEFVEVVISEVESFENFYTSALAPLVKLAGPQPAVEVMEPIITKSDQRDLFLESLTEALTEAEEDLDQFVEDLIAAPGFLLSFEAEKMAPIVAKVLGKEDSSKENKDRKEKEDPSGLGRVYDFLKQAGGVLETEKMGELLGRVMDILPEKEGLEIITAIPDVFTEDVLPGMLKSTMGAVSDVEGLIRDVAKTWGATLEPTALAGAIGETLKAATPEVVIEAIPAIVTELEAPRLRSALSEGILPVAALQNANLPKVLEQLPSFGLDHSSMYALMNVMLSPLLTGEREKLAFTDMKDTWKEDEIAVAVQKLVPYDVFGYFEKFTSSLFTPLGVIEKVDDVPEELYTTFKSFVNAFDFVPRKVLAQTIAPELEAVPEQVFEDVMGGMFSQFPIDQAASLMRDILPSLPKGISPVSLSSTLFNRARPAQRAGIVRGLFDGLPSVGGLRGQLLGGLMPRILPESEVRGFILSARRARKAAKVEEEVNEILSPLLAKIVAGLTEDELKAVFTELLDRTERNLNEVIPASLPLVAVSPTEKAPRVVSVLFTELGSDSSADFLEMLVAKEGDSFLADKYGLGDMSVLREVFTSYLDTFKEEEGIAEKFTGTFEKATDELVRGFILFLTLDDPFAKGEDDHLSRTYGGVKMADIVREMGDQVIDKAHTMSADTVEKAEEVSQWLDGEVKRLVEYVADQGHELGDKFDEVVASLDPSNELDYFLSSLFGELGHDRSMELLTDFLKQPEAELKKVGGSSMGKVLLSFAAAFTEQESIAKDFEKLLLMLDPQQLVPSLQALFEPEEEEMDSRLSLKLGKHTVKSLFADAYQHAAAEAEKITQTVSGVAKGIRVPDMPIIKGLPIPEVDVIETKKEKKSEGDKKKGKQEADVGSFVKNMINTTDERMLPAVVAGLLPAIDPSDQAKMVPVLGKELLSQLPEGVLKAQVKGKSVKGLIGDAITEAEKEKQKE